jgi:hypothetical protein
MGVWNKYGLVSWRWLRRRDPDPRYSKLPRETRFRLALEEQGGLPALFGFFLAGRADLLPSPHLKQLNKIQLNRDFSARQSVERELGDRASELRNLCLAPRAEIYQATYRGRPVVVEACSRETRENCEQAWKMFSAEIRVLEDGIEARVTQPLVLREFREWISLAGDLERKRAMLANLQKIPSGGVIKFPGLIPELQSDCCLAYTGTDADPLTSRVQLQPQEGVKSLRLLVEALLEQSLLLSLVDAEGKFANFTVLPDGNLGFRVLPVMAPVPLEWHHDLLQYMAATVAGQSPRALRMLSHMSSGHDSYAGEQRLMQELSGLQPELKINIVTPKSVASLENYWRALANSQMKPPLFLELFHRQWTLVGQYNGDVEPDADLVAESLWPVLGRILRYRFAEIFSAEKAGEWAVGSGLMILAAARQSAMLLEQVRDNDLALLLDRQESGPAEAKQNRRFLSMIRSAVTLAVFVLAAFLAYGSSRVAVRFVAGVVAAISALALAIFVAKIE